MAYYDNFNTKNTYYFKGDENSTIFRPINGLYGDPKKGFSNELYNYYMAKHEFAKAADYAMMFHAKDPKKDLERMLMFRRMKEEADLRSSLYGRLDPSEADELDFYDAYQRGDLDFLNPNSSALRRFNNLKKSFIYNNADESYKEPQKVSVTFEPDNRKFLWFNVKNDNGYKSFLERTGYNTAYLEGKGVEVKEDRGTGKYTLKFDYNSPIANDLMYNIDKHARDKGPGDMAITILGYDEKGNVLSKDNNDNPYYPLNVPIAVAPMDLRKGKTKHYVGAFSSFIDGLKSRKEKVYDKPKEVTFSSTIFGGPTDEIVQLKNTLDNIDPNNSELRTYLTTEINVKEKGLFDELGNVVQNLGNFEIYSNKTNKGEGELIPLDQTEYSDVRDEILQAMKLKDIRVSFGESGGKFGTFITLPRTVYDTKSGTYLNHPTYQVFLAGLWDTQAKDMAVHNTRYRALTKMDDITGLDYEFNLSDGRHIGAERNMKGNNGDYDYTYYIRNDGSKEHEYLSREDALNILDMYYMTNTIEDDLYVNFRNSRGDLIHTDKMDTYLKERVLWYINNLYTDTRDLELKDVFGGNSLDEKILLSKDYRLREKIEAAYNMYNRILVNTNNR